MTTYMHIRNNRYNRVTLSVKLSAPRIMCALNFMGLNTLAPPLLGYIFGTTPLALFLRTFLHSQSIFPWEEVN